MHRGPAQLPEHQPSLLTESTGAAIGHFAIFMSLTSHRFMIYTIIFEQ